MPLIKEFIKAQIQDLTNKEQIQFANWQRVQGAKAAYLQMLAEIEKAEKQPEASIERLES